MASERAAAALPFETGTSTLRPVDVTSEGLPVAMRGYDRERVDRLLERVAEAYASALRQHKSQRERLRSLEADLAAAEGEAAASARSVAELMQSSLATGHPPPTREALHRLEVRLVRSESEREQALADLRVVSERAAELGRNLETLEDEQRVQAQAEAAQPAAADGAEGDAARLLIAATRAAEDVRSASRARALHTLTKARELSALVHAQTERERVALAEMQERRMQLEREAEEILAEAGRVDAELQVRRAQFQLEAEGILEGARAEAGRIVAATEGERQRVRELLAGALASLGVEAATPPESLVGDLSSLLYEKTHPAVT